MTFRDAGCTDPDDVDPKLFMPFFDRIFCCLPNKSLEMMRCKMEMLDPEEVAVSDTYMYMYIVKRSCNL